MTCRARMNSPVVFYNEDVCTSLHTAVPVSGAIGYANQKKTMLKILNIFVSLFPLVYSVLHWLRYCMNSHTASWNLMYGCLDIQCGSNIFLQVLQFFVFFFPVGYCVETDNGKCRRCDTVILILTIPLHSL